MKRALNDSGTMLTTGEHEYTRYGFRQLLEKRCADIVQPDITWLGGMTEARRVVALASAYDVLVIPHGSSVYSYHLQYAFENCPMAEFLNLSPKSDRIEPYFGTLFPDEPLPKDGFIDLPDRPGFGVTLNKKGLRRPYVAFAVTRTFLALSLHIFSISKSQENQEIALEYHNAHHMITYRYVRSKEQSDMQFKRNANPPRPQKAHMPF